MGYSSWANAILGVKLQKKNFIVSESVRGCNHALPRERNAKFCAECGKAVWKSSRKFIPGFENFDDDPTGVKLEDDLGVFFADHDRKEFLIGFEVGKVDSEDCCERTDMPLIESELVTIRCKIAKCLARKELPAKILDTFGLYVVFTESY